MTNLTVMWHKHTGPKKFFWLKLSGLHYLCLWRPMNPLVVFGTPKNGQKQAWIEAGVKLECQNLEFQIFHVFYKIRCNFGVFQATIKCCTILESSGHWLRSPLIHFKHNVTKCRQMSINVKGSKNPNFTLFLAFFSQNWHFFGTFQ